MRIVATIAVGLGVAAFGLAVPAGAQVKGAGKLGISIIKVSGGSATVGAKAAGSVASKPTASIAGKPPTGGTTLSLKLAKDLGDPLKPGFAANTRYLLVLETSSTADGNAFDANSVVTFATLGINATGQCTIDANETVDGDGTGDLCGTAPDLCAPSAAGKCSITTYQIAGIPNYLLGPGDGQPGAVRFRLFTLPNETDCKTGDVWVGGAPLIGGTTCFAGTPVGVAGVANGDVQP